MNEKNRDMLSAFLVDVAKGLLIALAVGVISGKVTSFFWASMPIFISFLLILAAWKINEE